MKGKNVVVTGGAGFIGSNLVRILAKENQVVVVDDLSIGRLKNIQHLIDDQSITFVKDSVTNLKILQKIFKKVDYVFHEAAIASVPHSIKDPITTNNVNINGTLNVLLAARNNNAKKVVYASSCAIYGNPSKLPIKENISPNPLSPYAISKLVGEYYCKVFTDVYGLSTASLRYFNVYGQRQDPSSEYAAAVPKFINRVLNNTSPTIYGDGLQTRDFTYIKDVVDANIFAAESNATGNFNIAGGKRISINDLANAIMKICGKDLDFAYNDPRPGDIMHSLADISKAKKELDYEPQITLSEGLKETVQWFLKTI